MKHKTICLGLLLAITQPLLAQEVFYVAPNGNDSNTGTISQPFATIERARDEVRKHNASMTDDITVYIRGGKYYLNKEIALDERDSGFNGHRVIYKAYAGEEPEIYGGQPVTGWQQHDGNIYRAFVGIGSKFYNLCENEDAGLEARSGYFHVKYDRTNANPLDRSKELYYDPADIPDSYDLSQAAVHAWCGLPHWNWDPRVAPVLSVDRNNHIMHTRFDLSIGDTYTVWMTDARYYVRGVYEFLDEPGEFFMNQDDGYLYYWPRNTPIDNQHIVRATTDILFKIMGSDLSHTVSHITVEGLRLQLTESTHYCNRSDFMEKAEGQMRDSRGICPNRQGIVYIENGEYINVRFCKIFSSGIHGVALSFKALHCEVYGNWIKDVGNQAVSACGYTPDEHPFHFDPNYGLIPAASAPSSLRFNSIAEGNVNGYHTISNNRIENLGLLTGNGSGIKMYISSFNTVKNNDISNGPRHGISQSGPMASALEGFDQAVKQMDGNGIVWGENPSGQEGLYRSRGNIVMFNNLYDLVKDSNDVGPIHFYGTGWDPAQLSNYDNNGNGTAYVDSMGNPTGPSVGKYHNNVVAHNIMHDFYGMNDATLFFGIQNDNDSSYCVELYNMCYNWGAANANTAGFNNNGSSHLSRYNIIGGKKTHMNLPVDNNTTRTCAANAPLITVSEAEALAKAKGINWDYVGLLPDHPWPPQGSFAARLLADTNLGNLPMTVHFDASQHTSSDPSPTFEWDFDGDGIVDQTTISPTAQHIYTVKGVFDAHVKLIESITGESATATVQITAGNTLTATPRVHYQFDETSGNTAIDSSGNNYNGAITGTATWLPYGGEMDGALDCNGSVSIAVPSQVFDTVQNSYTIMFWTKSNGRAYTDNSWFHGVNSGGNKVFQLLTDVNNNFFEYYAGYDPATTPATDVVLCNTNNDINYTTDSLLNDSGQWIHWAFRKDATGAMDVYRNGEFLQDNTRDVSNQNPRNNPIQDIQTFMLGSNVDGTKKFNGVIDDFRVYDSLLTRTDIRFAILPPPLPAAPIDIVNNGTDLVSPPISNGDAITTFSAMDPNPADTHTWELLDDAGGRFVINPNTGALSIGNASYISAAASPTHSITIRVTDSSGRSFSKSFTLIIGASQTSNPYGSPTDVSGCLLWLDANDIDGDGNAEGASEAGLNGNSVLSWADKSSNGNNASQGGQPQLVENALSGKPAIRFDGIGDHFSFSSISTGRTFFWVLKDDDLGSGLKRPLLGDSVKYDFTRGDHSLWHGSQTTLSVRNGITQIDGQQVNGQTTDLTAGYHTISLLTDAGATAPIVSTVSKDRNIANHIWKGDMNEIIIYDSVLSTADRDKISNYLTFKWFQPLTGNYPPDSLNLSGTVVQETAVNNDVIGTLSATDPNTADTLSYSLTDNASGRFKLAGNNLQVADASALSPGAKYDIEITVTDNHGLSMSRIFELQVTGTATANTFAGWAQTNGLTGTPGADKDNDGVKDFAEYAFNMNPNSAADKAMAGSFAVQANGDVVYRFAKPIQGITHTVQYTSDLTGIWTNYTGTEADLGSQLEVSVPGSAAANGKLYIRLRLEE